MGVMKAINKLLDMVLAVLLSIMSILVFSNVIMRYVFNSALTWTDEAARYLYIWVIFCGALIAYRENSHLGVDFLVQKLSIKGKKTLFFINNLIILFILGLFIVGAWSYVMITRDQWSPALDIPLGIVYISGLLSVGGMIIVTLHNLFRLATNRISDAELVLTSEEDSEIVEGAIGGGADKGGKEV